MAEEILNKHIILEFLYEKKHTKNALKKSFFFAFVCIKTVFLSNGIVLGVRIAEILEKKKRKNPNLKNHEKSP